MFDLNIVEVQVEDLKKTIVTRNDEIHVLKERLKEKEGIIYKDEDNKRKLWKQLQNVKNTFTMKPSLIGERNLI